LATVIFGRRRNPSSGPEANTPLGQKSEQEVQLLHASGSITGNHAISLRGTVRRPLLFFLIAHFNLDRKLPSAPPFHTQRGSADGENPTSIQHGIVTGENFFCPADENYNRKRNNECATFSGGLIDEPV